MDGDLYFTTNNPVLLNNTHPLPPVYCLQRKAEKKVPTEQDMIKSNKLSFGDAIGATTNVITSQICLQAKFEKDSEEYKELTYRIICGQLYQQNCIDKAKGIICKPMPKGWKSKHEYKETEQDDEATRKRKRFLKRIAADRKPYFFIYNYDHLYTRYNRYLAKQENSCYREYGMTFEELLALPEKTSEQERFLKNCYEYNPVDSTPCVMNKICWHIENRIKQVDTDKEQYTFDPTLLKSVDHEYTSYRYYQAKPLLEIEYKKYRQGMKELMTQLSAKGIHGSERARILQDYTGSFLLKADVICSDEVLRCDLLIDIAYDSNASKKFVWEVCGSQIIKNLLARKDNTFYYPVKPLIDGEFTFKGETYSMIECHIEPNTSETHQNGSGRVLDVEVGNYTSEVSERDTDDFRGQYERFMIDDYNEWEDDEDE